MYKLTIEFKDAASLAAFAAKLGGKAPAAGKGKKKDEEEPEEDPEEPEEDDNDMLGGEEEEEEDELSSEKLRALASTKIKAGHKEAITKLLTKYKAESVTLLPAKYRQPFADALKKMK